jgi:hypothetical protein
LFFYINSTAVDRQQKEDEVYMSMPRKKSTPKQECLSLLFLAVIFVAGFVAATIDLVRGGSEN